MNVMRGKRKKMNELISNEETNFNEASENINIKNAKKIICF
jgi:hypothetical protein